MNGNIYNIIIIVLDNGTNSVYPLLSDLQAL